VHKSRPSLSAETNELFSTVENNISKGIQRKVQDFKCACKNKMLIKQAFDLLLIDNGPLRFKAEVLIRKHLGYISNPTPIGIDF